MAGRFSQAAIDDLLSRIDIIEIIQPRISLVKKGKNYQSCCPFHDEKTPSFSVSQQKQFYYCFGCGAHGNAINFLMNYDRLDFLDALAQLASHAGIEFQPDQASPEDPERPKLYKLMESACDFYEKQLKQSPAAINYLKKRGLTGRTAKTYRIGFSPDAWESLSKQFPTEDLLSTGMAIRNDNGKTYDRFRHRIMFPIRDLRGRVIAFGGRTMGDETPKYLNSPETKLFHKSNELYGLYEARRAHAQIPRLLMVEGYMDVIGLAEHGVTYAVATLGTAVNERHIQKALRYTNEIVFSFDGDRAGKQAAWKALTMALPMLRDDIHIRFLFLPEGEDPDSLIQKIGQRDFEQLLEKSQSLSSVFFESLSQQYPYTTMDGKAQFAHEALQYLHTMPSGIFHQLMLKQLAGLLRMNVEELSDIDRRPQENDDPIRPKKRQSMTLNPAQLASALLLQNPEAANETPSDTSYLDELNIQGKALLIFLQTRLKEPQMTTGKLLASDLTEPQKQLIAKLASIEFPLSQEAMKEEYRGAHQRLREMSEKQRLDNLIAKAKKETLTAEEKTELARLLTAKTSNER